MLLLSGLSSWLFARHFLKPIKAITQGAQQLAAGSFDIEVTKHSNDELGALSDDFNRLATTLRSNQSTRQQWIADISHELRTPLAILNGELEALLDGTRPTTPKALVSLHDEVNRLSRLVNDLYSLSLSDIGTLTYRKEAVDLGDAVDQCMGAFAERFSNRKVTLTRPVHLAQPLIIHADYGRITQMLSNLMENSARYTDEGGQVQIKLLPIGADACLIIQDSAPAVSESDIANLFERLYRAEQSRNRQTGGAGLGLSIVSNIVEAHEGEITASHSSLGGLQIEIRIPLLEGRTV